MVKKKVKRQTTLKPGTKMKLKGKTHIVKRRDPDKKESMAIIIHPSTKLVCMNVHKLQDHMTCAKYYYWRWVLNLNPTQMNLPFWFGSMMHKAWELIGITDNKKRIFKAMRRADKDFIAMYPKSNNDTEELDIQRRIGEAIISVYIDLFYDDLRGIDILDNEVVFHYDLEKSDVTLVGTMDAYGIKQNKLILIEYKTASRIDANYFAKLKFDKQINGYAIGLSTITGKTPAYCPYVVIRKPSIRVKQNETIDAFIERFKADLIERADWYFLKETIRFGKGALNSVRNDIEIGTFELKAKYDRLGDEGVLDHNNWARADTQCFMYGTCKFFQLCCNCNKLNMYTKFFQMREIRYALELEEVDYSINVADL